MNYMKQLTDNLTKDKEFRRAWVANIAMSYIDNENWYKRKTGKTTLNRADKHTIANNAAEYFLKLLCDDIKYPKGR